MAIVNYRRLPTQKPAWPYDLRYDGVQREFLGARNVASLTNGLAGFFPMNEGGGKPRMLPGYLPGTFSGPTLPKWSTQAGEECIKFAPAGDTTQTDTFIDYGTPPTRMTNIVNVGGAAVITGGFTFAARIWLASSSLSGGIAERNDNNATNIGWIFGVNNGAFGYITEYSSVNGSGVSAAVVPVGKWCVITCSLDNSNGNPLFFINGTPVARNTKQAPGGTQGSDAAQHLYLGRASFNQAFISPKGVFPGYISWFAAWSRPLTVPEMVEIGSRPFYLWTLLRPRSRWGIAVGPTTARRNLQTFIVT